MSTPEYCVYNETREHLLAPRVNLLDTRTDPLRAVKVLIEGLAPNAVTGLWLNPLKSIPAVPRLSPYDLVYLDRDGYVVDGVELVPDDEAPRIEGPAVSALLLPIHTFAASRAVPGDRFIMRRADEMPASAPAAAIAARQPAALLNQATSPAILPHAASPAALEKLPPQNLPPLAWTGSASTVALANSFIPPAALEPVSPTIDLRPPSPRRLLRFRLLHTLASLRIHVHISIATAPDVPPVVMPPSRPKRRDAVLSQNTWQLRTRQLAQLPANALSAVRPPLAKCASALRRQWTQCKTAYLRWADAFFFRPANKRPPRLSSVPDTPSLPVRLGDTRKPRFLR